MAQEYKQIRKGSGFVYAFPVLYALISRKTQALCVKVFQKVLGLVPEFTPTCAMADFEEASVAAYQQVFPAASAVGCWFDYAQNTNKIGLKDVYGREADVNMIVHCLVRLPLLPPTDITDATFRNTWTTTVHMRTSFVSVSVTCGGSGSGSTNIPLDQNASAYVTLTAAQWQNRRQQQQQRRGAGNSGYNSDSVISVELFSVRSTGPRGILRGVSDGATPGVRVGTVCARTFLCALRVAELDAGCPVCRAQITMVMRLFQ